MEGVTNPGSTVSKTNLEFILTTMRYTYDMGPVLLYEQSIATFSDDLQEGTVNSPKCDLSNSPKYGAYISNKEIPLNMNIFVDFTFTLEHPVLAGGYIDI